MPNMAAAINSHNKKILKPASEVADQPRCICGLGPDCPVQGTCSQKWVIYSAKVTETKTQKQKYTLGSLLDLSKLDAKSICATLKDQMTEASQS